MPATVEIKPQFLTDEQGRRTSVLLSIEDYESLLEAIEDAYDSAVLDHAIANAEGFEDVADYAKRIGLKT